MKKFLVLLVLTLMVGTLSAVAVAGTFDKPPAPPGQGECQHGNSGKECKPDPQPGHGQDCDEHGPNEGGVNEDHCLGTTTGTTTNGTTSITGTTTTTPRTPTSPPRPGDVTPPPPPLGPYTPPPTETTGTPAEEAPPADNAPVAAPPKRVRETRPGELPFTGFPLWGVALIGAGAVGSGLYLRRRYSR